MDYERIGRTGIEKVSAEIMLVCLGYVIRKMFRAFEGNAKYDFWIAPSDLKPEVIPTINFEKLVKRKKKVLSINEAAKKSTVKKK